MLPRRSETGGCCKSAANAMRVRVLAILLAQLQTCGAREFGSGWWSKESISPASFKLYPNCDARATEHTVSDAAAFAARAMCLEIEKAGAGCFQPAPAFRNYTGVSRRCEGGGGMCNALAFGLGDNLCGFDTLGQAGQAGRDKICDLLRWLVADQ